MRGKYIPQCLKFISKVQSQERTGWIWVIVQLDWLIEYVKWANNTVITVFYHVRHHFTYCEMIYQLTFSALHTTPKTMWLQLAHSSVGWQFGCAPLGGFSPGFTHAVCSQRMNQLELDGLGWPQLCLGIGSQLEGKLGSCSSPHGRSGKLA